MIKHLVPLLQNNPQVANDEIIITSDLSTNLSIDSSNDASNNSPNNTLINNDSSLYVLLSKSKIEK